MTNREWTRIDAKIGRNSPQRHSVPKITKAPCLGTFLCGSGKIPLIRVHSCPSAVGLIFGPITRRMVSGVQPLFDAELMQKLFQENSILSSHDRGIQRGRVLFYDQPIMVTLVPELLEHAAKIEASFTQW